MMRFLPAGILMGVLGVMAFGDPKKAKSGTDGEILLAPAKVGDKGIRLQVTSGGCTRKADFRIERPSSGGFQFIVRRLNPDHCEGYFPQGTTIEYTFSELGLSTPVPESESRRIEFLNPIDPDRKHHG